MSLYRLYKLGAKDSEDMLTPEEVYETLKAQREYYNNRKYVDGEGFVSTLPKPKLLPPGCIKMYNQPSVPHVPSKKGLDLAERYESGEKITDKNIGFKDVWEEQRKLIPLIGHSVFFRSIKMDAGWFRTSKVESFDSRMNGDVIINTENSVYLASRVYRCGSA